jgi:hypothetical protein
MIEPNIMRDECDYRLKQAFKHYNYLSGADCHEPPQIARDNIMNELTDILIFAGELRDFYAKQIFSE